MPKTKSQVETKVEEAEPEVSLKVIFESLPKKGKVLLAIAAVLVAGLAAWFSVYSLGYSLNALLLFIIICIFVTLSFIDQATMIIPNYFHFLILACAVASWWFGIYEVSLGSRIIGIFVVSVPMYIITCLTGGFGGGDIKLMAAAGALLGAKGVACAFFVGVFAAAIYCIYLLVYALVAIISKKASSFKEGMNAAMKTPFAFGPYLSLGIIVSYLYVDQILFWYLSTFMPGFGA